MSNTIEKDDSKLIDMLEKQQPNGPIIPYGHKEEDGQIENDDIKFEELLSLQSMSEPAPEHASIEEKYEEELVFEQIADIVNRRLAESRGEGFPCENEGEY